MSTYEDRIAADRVRWPETAIPNSGAQTPAAVATAGPRFGRAIRRAALAGVAAAAVLGAGYWAHDYWTVGRFEVSTDDAYVQADSTTIAPKVSGYIAAVLVRDNERVKAGQVLARIDDRDFRTALDQAKADVDAARATLAGKQAQLDAQHSVIDTARAIVEVDQANATFAEQDHQRYADLAQDGLRLRAERPGGHAKIAAARAAIDRDTASLAAAQKQIELIAAELAQARAAAPTTKPSSARPS